MSRRNCGRVCGIRGIGLGLALACGLSPACRAETVNIDFNTNGADTVHAAANGVYSRGGVTWNSAVSTNARVSPLVTEYGRTTGVGFASSLAAVPGYSSALTNTLQNTGFTKAGGPSAAYMLEITNLDASLQWDLAVYLSTNGYGILVETGPYWMWKTNAVAPTGQLPGVEGADYLLFTNMTLGEFAPRGTGTVVIFPAVGAQVAGLQLRASPGQVPPAATRYVAPGAGHVYPYDTWANAATSLQAAIAEPLNFHEVILVSNGVYSGAGLNESVCYVGSDYNIPYTLRSVNGPEYTIIDGENVRRCLYVADNSLVEGFTLRRGQITDYVMGGAFGGGAYVEDGEVARCIIVSNAVTGSMGMFTPGGNGTGGGVYVQDGVVRNCLVMHNTAYGGPSFSMDPMFPMPAGSGYGGGIAVAQGDVLNCTVELNGAYPGSGTIPGTAAGGGVYGGAAVNTIVCDNTPLVSEVSACAATYSCSPLLATNGTGNITGAPAFQPGSKYRLAAESPCRDAGASDFWTECGVDLDGLPRQLGGRVDMGASEFWGLSASPQVAAGTVQFRWHVVTGQPYTVQICTNLAVNSWSDAAPATSPVAPVLVFPSEELRTLGAYRIRMNTGP